MVPVSLHAECGTSPDCAVLARRIRDQLDVPKYSVGASVAVVSPRYPGDELRTARRRARRCRRLGYRFCEIDRSTEADAIHAINVSAPERQGRQMDECYRCRREYPRLPEYACGRHRVRTVGVRDRLGVLVAYMSVYRAGDAVVVSQILGHADRMRDDVMYLMVTELLKSEAPCVAYYNRHDSGTDGLRYFKEKLGFRERDVRWLQ